MLSKFFFLSVVIFVLAQSCHTNPVQTNDSNKGLKTDSILNQAIDHQSNKIDEVLLPCSDILPQKGVDYIQKIYSDTMLFDNSLLLFVTRDSALYIYRQKEDNCTFVLKIPIDSTDLYAYRDGSPLFLQDMDGDNQKEVLVTVSKNGSHSKYRVYRLVKDKENIRLKKISKFEALTNPEFDKTSGMVRSHWYDRGDYELDEFYKISKDDVLEFVKGMESRHGKDRKYEKK